MEDLIEALQIFLSYGNVQHPTHCEHDVMYIVGVEAAEVSTQDTLRLDQLGFLVSEEDEGFISYRFGSA